MEYPPPTCNSPLARAVGNAWAFAVEARKSKDAREPAIIKFFSIPSPGKSQGSALAVSIRNSCSLRCSRRSHGGCMEKTLATAVARSEEHTSELQAPMNLVFRLL